MWCIGQGNAGQTQAVQVTSGDGGDGNTIGRIGCTRGTTSAGAPMISSSTVSRTSRPCSSYSRVVVVRLPIQVSSVSLAPHLAQADASRLFGVPQVGHGGASAVRYARADECSISSDSAHTSASIRTGDSPESGSHEHIWSSSWSNDPTWWTRPCSYKAAIGSARIRLPLVAVTFRNGTVARTVRNVASTMSPPLLASATTGRPYGHQGPAPPARPTPWG